MKAKKIDWTKIHLPDLPEKVESPIETNKNLLEASKAVVDWFEQPQSKAISGSKELENLTRIIKTLKQAIGQAERKEKP